MREAPSGRSRVAVSTRTRGSTALCAVPEFAQLAACSSVQSADERGANRRGAGLIGGASVLSAGLGVTFYPWPEQARYQQQTLIARLCVRRGEPSTPHSQQKTTFAYWASQFETARYRLRFLMLPRWLCSGWSSMPRWRICFRWSWCLPW